MKIVYVSVIYYPLTILHLAEMIAFSISRRRHHTQFLNIAKTLYTIQTSKCLASVLSKKIIIVLEDEVRYQFLSYKETVGNL